MTDIGREVFGESESNTQHNGNVYQPGYLESNEEGTVISSPNGEGYIRTVPKELANIPYVIETPSGTYWLASSADEPLADWEDEEPWDPDVGNWRSDSGTMVKQIVSNGGYNGGWAFEMDLNHTSALWTFPAYSLNPLPEVGERFGVWWRHMNWASNRQFWIYVCQQNETQVNPETYRIEHRTDMGSDLVLRRSDNGDVLDTVRDIPTIDGKWYYTGVDFESDGPLIRTGDEDQVFGTVNASESNPLPPHGIGFRGNPDGHYFIDVPEKLPPNTDFTWD